MRTYFLTLFFSGLLLSQITISAQSKNDTLIFNNHELITGEIKSMQQGVLTVETEYSDSDFEIEWDKIIGINTENYFYVTLHGGKHYYGWIRSSDSSVYVISKDSTIITTKFDQIVHIISLNKGFKYQFNAEVDIGFSLAKSNNLRQLTASGKTGYKAEYWMTSLSGNLLSSIQDSTDPIKRAEANLVYQRIIYKDWYFVPELIYLTSSEQKLNSRWNVQLGVGNYLFRTNYAYWGLNGGFNWNFEDYFVDLPDRRGFEAFLGTELNLFDTGDLDLFFKTVAYKGITENDRWRFDGNLNLKYDLPLDFYIKIEFILNYDNRPVEGSDILDYVSTLGFGWEWDID